MPMIKASLSSISEPFIKLYTRSAGEGSMKRSINYKIYFLSVIYVVFRTVMHIPSDAMSKTPRVTNAIRSSKTESASCQSVEPKD